VTYEKQKRVLSRKHFFCHLQKRFEFNLGKWIPTALVKWTLLQGTVKPINEITMLGMKLISVYG